MSTHYGFAYPQNLQRGGGPHRVALLERRRRDDFSVVRAVRRALARLHADMNDLTLPSPSRPQERGREIDRIFEVSPALLAVAGFDGYLRRFNPAFEAFGYSVDELLSRPWIEFVHPDDRERLREASESLERDAAAVALESRVVCRDGSLRWVEWSTRSVLEEGFFYVAGRDVTESRRAAEEQEALRRVATLVAKQTPQAQILALIAEEIGRLLAVASVAMVRYEDDRVASVAADWGALAQAVPIGTRLHLGGFNPTTLVFGSARAARLDDYEEATGPIAERMRAGGVRSAVATPIVVEGRLWGAMIAASTANDALPPDTESRIGQFTELMTTAIAKAEARAEAARLADEQAALQRVATLVAHGASAGAVFDAVAEETGRLFGATTVDLCRFTPGGVVLTISGWSLRGVDAPTRTRLPIGGGSVDAIVRRTARPGRCEMREGKEGSVAANLRSLGLRSEVGAPVLVEGKVWGVLIAGSDDVEPLPTGAEYRLSGFAELIATAVANSDSRDQLAASRARVLAAADEARRHVVRDLHDGAQQRLVHTIVTLKLTQRALSEGRGDVEALLGEALWSAERATAEVRELAHGILPAVLSHRGLRAGIDALVSRLDVPVDVDVLTERLPGDIEASAYFIVAEALTNVVKHAQATRATVRATLDDGVLTLEVNDDGVGGADPAGHGLMGVYDRIDALGGMLRVESVLGAGTTLIARVPLWTRWSPRSGPDV